MQKLLIRLACVLALFTHAPAFAAFTQYDTEVYDLDANGVPKFVDVNYIDLRKITQISKFRSSAGHDYSDSTQFGCDALIVQFIGAEGCRSMKHYFIAPDASVKIYAPTSGVVSRRFDEAIGGTQIQITSDEQPAFTFLIFHVVIPEGELAVGTKVAAGQLIGHHTGPQTFSDIAVQVHTPKGYHHVSYFETLTDTAFAQFQARGLQTREQVIYTLAQRQADRFNCAGTSFVNLKTPPEQDYFSLTGGAQTQVINAPPSNSLYVKPGDPPMTFAATATSGLPVRLTTNAPRVCAVEGLTATFRRAGECELRLLQDGNDDIFAAPIIRYIVYNYPPASEPYPRIGGVFVPGTSQTLSMLRVLAGSAGNVKIALLDGDTGKTVATWTSPEMAAGTERQFAITDLEAAASAPLTRPSVYGLQVVSGGTMYGSIQHVLFNIATGVLTNASSCSTGINGNATELVGLHSSRFAGYPSAFTFLNTGTSGGNIFPFMQLRNSDTGARIGFGMSAESPDHSAIHPFAEAGSTPAFLEAAAKLNVTDTPLHYALITGNFLFGGGYVSHLVNNMAGGVMADMTAHCDAGGFQRSTILTPLATASIHSGQNATAQSLLRFYNAGGAAAPVTVTLHEPVYGAAVASWTSQDVAPNAELQVPVSAIEEATAGLTKLPKYTLSVDAGFEGAFQHILWKAPSGALSNASTCGGGSVVDRTTVIAVHSGLLAAAGFPSTVIVNNLGAAPAAANLSVYDAATGNKLGGFTTSSIPSGAQAQFDSAALENRAGFSAVGKLHYVVKRTVVTMATCSITSTRRAL